MLDAVSGIFCVVWSFSNITARDDGRCWDADLAFSVALLRVRIRDLVPHVLTFSLVLIQGIIWRECNSAIAMDLHLLLHYLANRQSG